MSSQEIHVLMENNNFHIKPSQCIDILNTSPQVEYMGKVYKDHYEIISQDGYDWIFTLELSSL